MKLFVALMVLGSSFTMIKMIVLATIMQANDFGKYITLFGIASISGVVMSVGLIEKTYKAYPRLWVSGAAAEMYQDMMSVSFKIGMRFIVCLPLILIPVAYYQPRMISAFECILTALLALCVTFGSLLASAFRAFGYKMELPVFTVIRGFCAIVFSVSMVYFHSTQSAMQIYQIAIFGDIIAAILVLVWGVYRCQPFFNGVIPQPSYVDSTRESINSSSGHYELYVANLLLTSTVTLDRLWIGSALSASIAGAYGVLMLIPIVSQILTNIVVQYVGPLVIKYVHLGHQDKSVVSNLTMQFGILGLICLIGTSTFYALTMLPFLQFFFDKYPLSLMSILFAGILAFGQGYAIVEFHLIARNREKTILISSFVFFVILLFCFSLCTILELSLSWFIASLALARWLQIFSLVGGLVDQDD